MNEQFMMRIPHEREYVCISNQLAQDSRTSLELKGLLLYVLSKPDNWKIRIDDIRKQHNLGRDKVYKLINEAITHGYIRREILRSPDGRVLATNYYIYEKPLPTNQEPVAPDTVTPDTDIQEVVKTPKRRNTKRSAPLPDRPDTENQDNYKVQSLQSTDKESTDSVTPSADTPLGITSKTKKTEAKQPTPHQELMTAYQNLLGYPIPNGGKEGAAAKKLLAAGYTVSDIRRCYEYLKRQPFYQDKHLSLHIIHENIGAFLNAAEDRNHGRQQQRRPDADHAARPTHEYSSYANEQRTLERVRQIIESGRLDDYRAGRVSSL